MPVSVAFIRKLEKVSPDLREILLGLLEELERQRAESVGKQEFDDLRNIVRDLAEAQQRAAEKIEALAEAQRRTEQRVEELAEAQKRTEQRVEELAEAQRRTDERLNSLALKVEELAEAQKRTEQRVEELAEAQRRTDERLNSLALKVEELAEAQKRTEQRVEELAEAQRRTDERLNALAVRVEELAEAQKRTEMELRALASEHRKTREQLGGLAITVGYRLEDEAFRSLPRLLERDYQIVVEGRLRRQFVRDKSGKYVEVNIIGEGRRGEEKVTIIGEGKSQLSRKDVDRFIQRRLKRLEGVFENIFPVLVTYMISEPEVEEYVKARGLALYYSFDF
ncbi:hypothetical protein [Thermodesulforhabdus norvegica]|uniref:Chordopoxvirus fusion protein n=1 Tax=Thermodesulforhabdus norvegica TaxID=39841 RepID=A0A1I4SFT6_9BACT|nr:hypothetical protein [Thermodesulforhabdus norvegica]SFM63181.1 hypothetical protein SAMN05660836_00935 [Thermodesulforhabdus norvegica]